MGPGALCFTLWKVLAAQPRLHRRLSIPCHYPSGSLLIQVLRSLIRASSGATGCLHGARPGPLPPPPPLPSLPVCRQNLSYSPHLRCRGCGLWDGLWSPLHGQPGRVSASQVA